MILNYSSPSLGGVDQVLILDDIKLWFTLPFLILRLTFSILHNYLLYNSPILRRRGFFLNTEVNIPELHDNLLQYFLILNVTNYCPSPLGKKGGFFRIGVRVRVMDALENSSQHRDT